MLIKQYTLSSSVVVFRHSAQDIRSLILKVDSVSPQRAFLAIPVVSCISVLSDDLVPSSSPSKLKKLTSLSAISS